MNCLPVVSVLFLLVHDPPSIISINGASESARIALFGSAARHRAESLHGSLQFCGSGPAAERDSVSGTWRTHSPRLLGQPPPKDRVLVPAPAPTKTGGWTRHFQWGLVQSTTNTNSFNSQWSGLYDVYLKSLVCSSRPRPRSRVVVAPAPKQPSSRAGLRTSRPSIWRGGWWQRWCGASERGMWHRLARQLLPRKNSMKRDIPVCF